MTIQDRFDFNKPHVGYEDSEKRHVCGCCGTYYVVQPGELTELKEIVTDLYEACKWSIEELERLAPALGDVCYSIITVLNGAKLKADGKEV